MKTGMIAVGTAAVLFTGALDARAGSYSVSAIEDTFVVEGSTQSYHTSQYLYADRYVYDEETYTRRTLVKFDLSEVPDGSALSSASFHLYSFFSNDYQFDLYHLDDDAWDDSSVTWADVEAADMTLIGGLGGVRAEGWNQWQIDLAAWGYATDLSDDTLTLVVASTDLVTAHSSRFQSMDYGNYGYYTPYLELSDDPAPVPLPGAAVLLASGLTGLALATRRKTG